MACGAVDERRPAAASRSVLAGLVSLTVQGSNDFKPSVEIPSSKRQGGVIGGIECEGRVCRWDAAVLDRLRSATITASAIETGKRPM